MKFRDDQKPIMEYEGGIMAVPAVPGAGKTFIISSLAAKLIEEGMQKPGKILVVTYMNSAVSNFKNRIRAMTSSIGGCDVMTIHSLALKIIKEKPSAMGLDDDFNIVDDYTQRSIMDIAAKKWAEAGGSSIIDEMIDDKYRDRTDEFMDEFAGTASTLIGELKLRGIKYEDIKKSRLLNRRRSIIWKTAGVYDFYERELKNNGFVDYNDLLYMACDILKKDGGVLKKFQKRYTYVFEDECQDSNLIQGKILELISGGNGNLVRVGDVNQSITGTFTSSNPELFKSFSKSAEHKFVMDMAGRSSKNIINIANSLVKFVRNGQNEEPALEEQIIKPVPEGQMPKNPVVSRYNIFAYKGRTQEDEMIEAAKTVKKIRQKEPDKTIAVLVPTNADVSRTDDVFKSIGIDCESLSSMTLERTKIIRLIGSIMAFLALPDMENFMRYLDVNVFEDMTGSFDDLKKKISESDVHDAVYNTKSIFENADTDAAKKAQESAERLRSIIEYGNKKPESIILHIKDVYNFSDEDAAVADAAAWYIGLCVIRGTVKSFRQAQDVLLDRKNGMINHIADVVYEMKGYEPVPEKVTICTYHKSKGLEWDYVFLFGLTSYNFPFSTSDRFRGSVRSFRDEYKNAVSFGKNEIKVLEGKKEESDPVYMSKIQYINERARLLYVGITRAREGLFLLTYAKSELKNGKTINQSDSEYFKYLRQIIDNMKGGGGNVI